MSTLENLLNVFLVSVILIKTMFFSGRHRRIISFSDCRFDQINERRTILSGMAVTLKCSWDYKGSLFWIRLVPGKLPEVLGKTFGSKTADSRIRITEETKASFLRIERAKMSDTGYYYCMKYNHELTFFQAMHLSVEGK